ncbi:unnamed protein product [Ceratitis capitata]|uniref:(Mediterranean fruit fly) hypothetical protein n=1 Tax=Ceratitis capitata TaxID=7213 RepID=A0A811UHI1_CERCA|nr:unnamed protein product [Ceratitis capitata]
MRTRARAFRLPVRNATTFSYENPLFMFTVKRSSNNANELMSKVASNEAAPTSANKKSSPEVLPPAYNMPLASQQSTGNNLSNGEKVNDGTNTKTNSNFDRQTAGTLPMQSNEDIINSAIAAGLTAAAVEAAAAASQREMAEQQLKQQAQPYGDENSQTLLHKRGISSPQYIYGGMGGMGMGGAYGYGNVNGNDKGNGYESGNNGNSGYGGGDYFNNPYLNTAYQVGSGVGIPTVPTGFWADEMDPSVVYTDIQDEDFLNSPRASSYRNKAYDNLQNILNSEAYPEPMALSLPQPQYTSRYYGAINDNKRSNRYDNGNNGGSSSSSGRATSRFTDMRLKRDTKLTPADMLALVALVEAGERARKDTDTEIPSNNNYMYPSSGIAAASEPYNNYNGVKTYYPTTANMDGSENGASWLEPNMMDYYAMPMNMETIPKYELQREHKYGGALAGGNGNRFGIKRFMVSKKNRPMGNFLNEPVSKPSMSYNVNSEKFY